MKIWLEKPEAQERFNICKTCEFLDKKFFVCKKCGCFMKAKVKLAKAKCPLNYW